MDLLSKIKTKQDISEKEKSLIAREKEIEAKEKSLKLSHISLGQDQEAKVKNCAVIQTNEALEVDMKLARTDLRYFGLSSDCEISVANFHRVDYFWVQDPILRQEIEKKISLDVKCFCKFLDIFAKD